MATGRRVSGAPGTGFVGLDDWQAANASGARSLADRLAGRVDSAGMSAQRGLDNLGRDFGERMEEGTLRFFGDGLDSARAEYLGREAYAGPNGLRDVAGYDEAFAGADKAGQSARQVGDLYGRATALQDMATGPYSSGQRLLDSALAGGAGGSRFAQLGAQWGGLFNRAQGMESAAAGAARDARSTSSDAAQQYASAAPGLRQQEERRANDSNTEYIRRVEAEQDERERRMREADRVRNRAPTPGATPGRKGAEDFFKGW